VDTIICRKQSGLFQQATSSPTTPNGKSLYHGLYQGFAPVAVASIPASIAFFSVYEAVKRSFAEARANDSQGYMRLIPQSVDYAASSALAELVACAILNPAQVVKQNAQVWHAAGQRTRQRSRHSPTLQLLKQFSGRPTRLWTGYTVQVATQLPCVCLTFAVYESLKDKQCFRQMINGRVDDQLERVAISAWCGIIAGSSSCWAFVPADVVKMRMRLTAGQGLEGGSPLLSSDRMKCINTCDPIRTQPRPNVLIVAQSIIRHEGMSALFRGSLLTCLAAGLGSGVYLGSYEAFKIYCGERRELEVLT
jgi:solute carrier family 25 (mitochondrial S-adenosylmethionine transporter), member 26